MKVLLINGSPNEKGCTYTALNEVNSVLIKHNIETELLYLGKNVANCTVCDVCKKVGRCIIEDKVNYTVDKLDDIDGIIVGSPVYFSGPSGQIVSYLNRLFYTSGNRMAGKLGASVVSCRRGGATATFEQLNKYFTIKSMPIVSSSYWNQVHGNTPEEVLEDKEGLQVMRNLGENMAWLLKLIENGRINGIEKPVYEKTINTNFIR